MVVIVTTGCLDGKESFAKLGEISRALNVARGKDRDGDEASVEVDSCSPPNEEVGRFPPDTCVTPRRRARIGRRFFRLAWWRTCVGRLDGLP